MRHISGAGQFAVVPLDDNTCRLFMTMAEAYAIIANPMRCMVCDLAERELPDFDKMPDIEDANERRARRQAARQRASTATPAAQPDKE